LKENYTKYKNDEEEQKNNRQFLYHNEFSFCISFLNNFNSESVSFVIKKVNTWLSREKDQSKDSRPNPQPVIAK